MFKKNKIRTDEQIKAQKDALMFTNKKCYEFNESLKNNGLGLAINNEQYNN